MPPAARNLITLFGRVNTFAKKISGGSAAAYPLARFARAGDDEHPPPPITPARITLKKKRGNSSAFFYTHVRHALFGSRAHRLRKQRRGRASGSNRARKIICASGRFGASHKPDCAELRKLFRTAIPLAGHRTAFGTTVAHLDHARRCGCGTRFRAPRRAPDSPAWTPGETGLHRRTHAAGHASSASANAGIPAARAGDERQSAFGAAPRSPARAQKKSGRARRPVGTAEGRGCVSDPRLPAARRSRRARAAR